MSSKVNKYMTAAIKLSLKMMQENKGGPFGAVIVKDGEIISEGWNKVTSENDPTCHAEITAIRNACKKLGNFSLSGCEIYSSCEPCPMCLGAIYWAKLDKLFFGASREDAASIGFDDSFIYDEIPKHIENRQIPTIQVSQDDAKQVFSQWSKKTDKIMY